MPSFINSFFSTSALSSITQVLSATSTATTITAPSGIQSGDLIVLYDFASGFSTPTSVVPTGFTAIANNTTTQTRGIASYKKASGTEGGTSITGMAPGSFGTRAKVLYVFRGDIAAATLTVGSTNSQGISDNPTAQVVTASGGVAPLVVLGFYGSDNTISARTFTVSGSPAKDAELSSIASGTVNANTWIAYKIFNTSPADATVDFNDIADNSLASCYIQMAS